MAYAIVTDIEAEFKNITFNATSAVTDTEVTEFISQEEAVINATISNRYEVPTEGTESIKVMKSISIMYVAYRVAKILNLKKDVPIPEKMVAQTLNEGSAFRKAEKTLLKIQKGTLVLTDATALSSGQGIQSYNSENCLGPLWERDVRQW